MEQKKILKRTKLLNHRIIQKLIKSKIKILLNNVRILPLEDPKNIQDIDFKANIVKHEVTQSFFEVDRNCQDRLKKIFDWYQIPLNFVRDITITPVEEENWNKYYAMIHPFASIYFLLIATGRMCFIILLII